MSRPAKRPEQQALFAEIPDAPPAPRVNDRREAAALAEVLQVLKHHPLVAWVERQNSGVARMGSRFVRFGWPGCSDVLGQLKDGRLLAVECKAPKGKATDEQAQFLSLVRRFGGVAFLARDCRDVLRELAADEAGHEVRRRAHPKRPAGTLWISAPHNAEGNHKHKTRPAMPRLTLRI